MIFKLKEWSNFLFIIPLIFALILKVYFMAGLIFVTMFVSLIHHYYEEKKWIMADRTVSLILILANLILFYFFIFSFPYFYLVLLFVGVAFYFYFNTNKNNYDLYHSFWHLSSVIITIFCIIGYGTSF